MSNNLFKTHLTSPIIRYFGAKKAKKHFTQSPIFIGGCARSGTSLLLSILSAHPKIFCFPNETDAFTEWKNTSKGLVPTRIDRMYRALLLNGVPKEAVRWCEKRPYNVRYIKEILTYYGSEARFIHLVRDPRAVCTSRHPSLPDQYWVSPERWVRDVSAGMEYLHHSQVLTIRYEDLILETPIQIQRICDFIGEEFVTELRDWPTHAKVREHAAWFDGITEIQKSSLEKWKAPEHQNRVEEVMRKDGVKRFIELLESFKLSKS